MDTDAFWGDYEGLESLDECAQSCYGCRGFDAFLVGFRGKRKADGQSSHTMSHRIVRK